MKPKLLRSLLITSVWLKLATDASGIDADLRRFCSARQQQIRDFARGITNEVPGIVWQFFDAVRVDDWKTATNLATRINMASRRYLEGTNDQSISPALATLIWLLDPSGIAFGC